METIGHIGIVISGLIVGLCTYQFGKLLALYLRERGDRKPKLRIVEGGFVVGRHK